MDTERWAGEEIASATLPSVRHGIVWNTGGQIVARAITLLIILALARLLTPRDFGLVAVGSAIIAFATVVTDIGVGSALVQRQHDVRESASAAFYMNALMMVSFAGVLLILAGPIADYFDEPMVAQLLPVMTAAFLIRGSMAVHEAYLRKWGRFRRVQLINLAGVVAYGVAAVALAWRGAGAWSLAWGLLASSVAYSSLMLWGSGMPLSADPFFHHWRGLFAYGRWVFLGGAATWLLQAGDNLAVGKFLGPTDLGAYAIAYSYGLIPLGLIGGAIAQAAFPAYARLQDEPDRLHALLMKVVRLTALVSWPLAVVLFFSASDILVALLGPKWAQAGPPFRVFAVVFTAGMFTASFPRVYDAVNRPAVNLYVALAALPVMVAGTAIGLHWGVLGVSIGISAMASVVVGFQVFAVSRTTGLPGRTILAGVWPSAACAGVGVVAGLLPWFVLRSAAPSLAVDALASLVSVGVYALCLHRFFKDSWAEAEAEVEVRTATVGGRSAG